MFTATFKQLSALSVGGDSFIRVKQSRRWSGTGVSCNLIAKICLLFFYAIEKPNIEEMCSSSCSIMHPGGESVIEYFNSKMHENAAVKWSRIIKLYIFYECVFRLLPSLDVLDKLIFKTLI